MNDAATETPEEKPHNPGFEPQFVRNMVESFLRIGLIVILLLMSYDIISHFLYPYCGARLSR